MNTTVLAFFGMSLWLSAMWEAPNLQADEAKVIEVQVKGKAGSYQFQVTLSTPDKGCQQYADWWEVVDASGELVYRRILAHSHVEEQPFTRSGGPVEIVADQEVWIRVHMNNTGYSQWAMYGSPADGFFAKETETDFASDLEQQSPLTGGCRF